MNTKTDIQSLLGRQLKILEKKNAPQAIYCEGSLGYPLILPRVSIIGSRKASDIYLESAKQIARILTRKNVTIVSGLAKGIDTAAQQSAIEQNGKTIAVLGTPLNKTYPKENAELQKEIMKNHLAITQYPVGHYTSPRDFAIRNHLMALISDASVIVQAADGSGTLHHGWETLRLGKPLFICKQASSMRWNKEMIEHGAMELKDPEDIFDFITDKYTDVFKYD